MTVSRGISKSSCIAVLGTGSDVGKSIVCTALCRIVSNAGYSVAPFKAQNMSNNSWVTEDGGEIGRAQVVQAEAARIVPQIDINPILLKPCTDTGSQVVLHGHPQGNVTAQEYWNDTDYLFQKAWESFKRLRERHDLIIMEGAGSCAEMNLRKTDFVNFRIAQTAQAPVILVADIDRGGVFAQVVGTLEIIAPEERKLVQGIIINRFRGDPELFTSGIEYIEERTNIPVLGLIPYYYHIDIESEDGVILDTTIRSNQTFEEEKVTIGVLKLPHISNFTDFAVLQRDASISLRYLYRAESLDHYDLIILPGTKNVRFDLDWLKQRGWEQYLRSYIANGGNLIGICGGYQMLGTTINDPHGIEGPPGSTAGFGFLACETELLPEKILTRVTGTWLPAGTPIEGYEIHMGLTTRDPKLRPAIHLTQRKGGLADLDDGALSEDGRVWGCYVHGLFDQAYFTQALLKILKPDAKLASFREDHETVAQFKDRQYNLLAEHFRTHLDLGTLAKIMGFDLK